jgi:DUF4097 and DUF4098 domain-containing protein YvlB
VSPQRQNRGSIFGGLLLILLGVIALIDRYDPAFRLGHWIARFWPLLLIVWGAAKLIEHLRPTHDGGSRPSILTAGEALLLIACVIVLFGFVSRDWLRNTFPNIHIELPPFDQSYSEKGEMPPRTIPVGSHVQISTARGDIRVTGKDGDEILVHTNESRMGTSESGAKEEMKDTRVLIEQTADGYSVRPVDQSIWSGAVTVDLNVDLPKSAVVTVNSGIGDIQVGGVTGNITVRSGRGDVQVRDAGGNVDVLMGSGDLNVANASGDVRIAGHGGDAEISNVGGDASLLGVFDGSITVQNVAKLTKCISHKADLSLDHLGGKLELDSRDVSISQVSGATRLTTSDKDIGMKGVDGSLEIADSRGDIDVTYYKSPQAPTNITDDTGEIKVTLPANSNVLVNAMSKSGEVQSDFGGSAIQQANDDNMGRLNGQIGSGGPPMHIVTSYGTIELRKAH